MGRLFLLLPALAVLLLQAANAVTPISSCGEINSPGYYYLTGDLTGFKEGDYCIRIFASNVVLEGNGFRITGNGWGYGIYVSGASNVTIENITVKNYEYGIYFGFSSNNTITNIIASNNRNGIVLYYSKYNMMTKINASNNSFSGIKLRYSSSNNAIKDSVLQNNGILVEESYNNNVINTTVNGKPLVYLENEKNRVVDNAGQVILVNCRNVTVKDLDLSNATVGVEILNSEQIRVENVTARNNWFGIALVFSNNTIITNVTATNNKGEFPYLPGYGVSLEHSNNNTIANVTASNNWDGIYLSYSSNNTITNVNVNNNGVGIYLYYSSYNRITGATVKNNSWFGISLQSSGNNTIKDSVLQNNGLLIIDSYNNIVENTTVNRKPLVYLENVQNYEVNESSNAGQVILVNCANITVKNLDLSNASVGVELWGSEWIRIENVIASNNLGGLVLFSSSNNTIKDSVLQNNSYGIVLESSSNNLIYNNYFNNTYNVTIYDSQPNAWNITKTEGTNIVGGNYLGGNYWGSPYGSGFSDVCKDSDSDGICDQPFAIDGNNTDYLPLAASMKTFNVSGFVSYRGKQTGEIWVCAIINPGEQKPPFKCSEVFGNAYNLELPEGNYYIAAFMDVNGNLHPDSAEPIGFAIEKKYPESADQIQVSRDISNVNITLYDVDLAIGGVKVSPEKPAAGIPITISVAVVNLGGSFAENFNVSLLVNGSEVESKIISLYFNETKYVNFTGSPQAGTYEVKIVVDPDNKVYESDEGNNQLAFTITVSPEVWQAYDRNGNGKIETVELIKAIQDWLNNKLSTMDLIKVIQKWLQS